MLIVQNILLTKTKPRLSVEKKGVENLENLQNKDANREVKEGAGVCSVKSSSSSKSLGGEDDCSSVGII